MSDLFVMLLNYSYSMWSKTNDIPSKFIWSHSSWYYMQPWSRESELAAWNFFVNSIFLFFFVLLAQPTEKNSIMNRRVGYWATEQVGWIDIFHEPTHYLVGPLKSQMVLLNRSYSFHTISWIFLGDLSIH